MTPTTILCLKCLATGALVTISSMKRLTGHGSIWLMCCRVILIVSMLPYSKEMRRKDWYATVKHSNIGANIFLLIGLSTEIKKTTSGQWVIQVHADPVLRFLSISVTLQQELWFP